MHNSKLHAIFFMIRSLEPCDPWEIMIESPTIDDGTNPYLETPDNYWISAVLKDLIPEIFPGGGESSGGGGAGDWFSTPVSGDGMLAEISTFCGYASDWTWARDGDGVMVAERERFLGSYTISRTGGGAWKEEPEHRRGFDEPLKRLTIAGVVGESGYYLERYVFDGQHIPRNDSKSSAYPNYDYDAPISIRDAGDYDLSAWLFDRLHSYPHMVDDNWIEYRCPTYSVNIPNQTISTYPRKEEHRNIVVCCDSDELWHVWNNRQYDIYAEYDIYIDDVYISRDIYPYAYSSYLYDYPADVLSQEEQRQHYPKIGTERVTLAYKPSVLPVILGGSLPSLLILTLLVMLCAVSNSNAVSSTDSRIDEEKKRRKLNGDS